MAVDLGSGARRRSVVVELEPENRIRDKVQRRRDSPIKGNFFLPRAIGGARFWGRVRDLHDVERESVYLWTPRQHQNQVDHSGHRYSAVL